MSPAGRYRSGVRLPASLIVLGSLIAPASLGETPAQSVRPDFSRCITLRDLLARYEHHTSLHTGQQARADLALDRDCRDGRYRDGIATLEAMLRRGLIPMPR